MALQWSGRDSSQGSMFALQLQPSRVPTGTQSGFRRRRREPAVLTSADFLRGFLTAQGDWIPPPDPGPADTPKKLRMAFSYRMQRLNASTARRTPTPTRGARRIGSAVNPQGDPGLPSDLSPSSQLLKGQNFQPILRTERMRAFFTAAAAKLGAQM